LSSEIKEETFAEMTKELLANLGFNVVKEQHHIIHDKKEVGLCVKFDSDIFLRPKYSPTGLSFIECCTSILKDQSEMLKLDKLIKSANSGEEYKKRMGGQIEGGILVYSRGGDEIPMSLVKLANRKKYFCWDIHRIFFYAMKIFSHSILENWVSESKLGFVLNEAVISKQFEPEHYSTTKIIGIRYSEMSGNIEVYFSYFCDCLKDPQEATLGINSLHREHVEKILDDVYENLKWISSDFYSNNEKDVTVEVHSLSGFTEDAEMGAKLFAHHYKDWKSLKIKNLKIDEHTLFKYSVIPWEAVMDYAFTKRTGKHTISMNEIYQRLYSIEIGFAEDFMDGVKRGDISEEFTGKKFVEQKTKIVQGYQSIYHAHVTRIPIKQRLIIFSKTSLKVPRQETMKNIIDELKKRHRVQLYMGRYHVWLRFW